MTFIRNRPGFKNPRIYSHILKIGEQPSGLTGTALPVSANKVQVRRRSRGKLIMKERFAYKGGLSLRRANPAAKCKGLSNQQWSRATRFTYNASSSALIVDDPTFIVLLMDSTLRPEDGLELYFLKWSILLIHRGSRMKDYPR